MGQAERVERATVSRSVLLLRNRWLGDLSFGDLDLEDLILPMPLSRRLTRPLSLWPACISLASLCSLATCEGGDADAVLRLAIRALRGDGWREFRAGVCSVASRRVACRCSVWGG
jgi:hypothetical protein